VITTCAQIEEHLPSGETVAMTIWDTAGQEKFRAITIPYYRDADVAFICFDPSRAHPEIRTSVGDWLTAVLQHAGPKCLLMLVATKCDLLGPDAAEGILTLGEEIANANKMAGFYMTSAKTGQGITELFVEAAQKARRSEEGEKPPSLAVSAEPRVRRNKDCC
jgi:small GTP-binding protein